MVSELEREILNQLSYREWKSASYIKNRINPNEYNMGLMNANFYASLVALEVMGLIKSRRGVEKEYIKSSGGDKQTIKDEFQYYAGTVGA